MASLRLCAGLSVHPHERPLAGLLEWGLVAPGRQELKSTVSRDTPVSRATVVGALNGWPPARCGLFAKTMRFWAELRELLVVHSYCWQFVGSCFSCHVLLARGSSFDQCTRIRVPCGVFLPRGGQRKAQGAHAALQDAHL